jgi:hypothetical protein
MLNPHAHLIQTKSGTFTTAYWHEKLTALAPDYHLDDPEKSEIPLPLINVDKTRWIKKTSNSEGLFNVLHLHKNGQERFQYSIDSDNRRQGVLHNYDWQVIDGFGPWQNLHSKEVIYICKRLTMKVTYKDDLKHGETMAYLGRGTVIYENGNGNECQDHIETVGGYYERHRMFWFENGAETGKLKFTTRKAGIGEMPWVSEMKMGTRINGEISGMFRIWKNGKMIKQTYYNRKPEDLVADGAAKDEPVESLTGILDGCGPKWAREEYEIPNRSSLMIETFDNGQIMRMTDYVRGQRMGGSTSVRDGTNTANYMSGVHWCINYDRRVGLKYVNFIGPEVLASFSGSVISAKGHLMDVYGRVVFTGEMKSDSNYKFVPRDGLLKVYYEN